MGWVLQTGDLEVEELLLNRGSPFHPISLVHTTQVHTPTQTTKRFPTFRILTEGSMVQECLIFSPQIYRHGLNQGSGICDINSIS